MCGFVAGTRAEQWGPFISKSLFSLELDLSLDIENSGNMETTKVTLFPT